MIGAGSLLALLWLRCGILLRLLDLAFVLGMRLVADSHSQDGRGHADNQRGIVPPWWVILEGCNSAQKEHAHDRGEIANGFPVNALRDRLCYCSVVHGVTNEYLPGVFPRFLKQERATT